MLRAGTLTAVWVPDEYQEAMCNLVRARGDMKKQEQEARQQLSTFILRSGHMWPSGRSRWGGAHLKWLEELKLPHRFDQVVLQEYVNAVREAGERVAEVSRQIEIARERCSLTPAVEALVALRGVDSLSATILMAELGDISRFTKAEQLFSYLGLVPGEYSSGAKKRQGRITRAGNGHARRVLVECAWSYRFPARNTAHIKRKSRDAPRIRPQDRVARSEATLRTLHEDGRGGQEHQGDNGGYRRELAGFVWDIVRHEMHGIKEAAA